MMFPLEVLQRNPARFVVAKSPTLARNLCWLTPSGGDQQTCSIVRHGVQKFVTVTFSVTMFVQSQPSFAFATTVYSPGVNLMVERSQTPLGRLLISFPPFTQYSNVGT